MARQNFVYVFADQLGLPHCGYAGNGKAQTPEIDAFAASAVDFRNAISGTPVCAPYRASLFTGKYQSSTGMVINEIRMSPRHRCIGHVLHEGGYATSYIGKWHLYANQLGRHLDPRNSFIPPGEHRLGFDGFFAAYNFHHEYYGAPAYYHLDTPAKHYVDGYEPDVQTDLAISQLEQLSDGEQPFALFLSLGTPHDPWEPWNVPGEWLEKFDGVEFELPPNAKEENDPYADWWAQFNERVKRSEVPDWMRVYYAMTANLDWNFGRLLKAVDRLGLTENTTVVFTSDHGEMFGAQGRRAKNIFYEEAVRVPFLVRTPGGKPAVRDVCLNTPDIMPSLLGQLGLPIPEEVEGNDLSPWFRGETGPDPEFAFLQGMGPTALFRDGHEWRAVRTKQFTYARYLVDGKELLFDHVVDPLQMNDLADDPARAGTLRMLRDGMAAKMAELKDDFQPNTWYEKNWIRDRIILRTATLEPETP